MMQRHIGGDWDVVVVGAGPAGALAAVLLARRGRRVLLVDQATFPRDKVCGCCVNALAVRTLVRHGLGTLLADASAVPLRRVRLAAGGRLVDLPLGGGVALSRRALDGGLVHAATKCGAVFLAGTSARLLPAVERDHRSVRLGWGREDAVVRARVVLACDGLRGRLLEGEATARWIVAGHGRIGVSAILPAAPAWCEAGTVYMAVGRGGYAGLVRLEDDRLDVAAAVDPDAAREAGGPGKLVRRILTEGGLRCPEGWEAARPHGTPRLTRRRRMPGAWRVLAVGDSAGYVEPFTGEGIAWALLGARAVVPVVEAGLGDWPDGWVARWAEVSGSLLGRRRAVCLGITRALRRERLARLGVGLARAWPGLAGGVHAMLSA